MLKKLKYVPLTTNEIKPEGWLKRQLEVQAEGLSGNLYKVWPDIRDSRWIGGNCEGWERVPYWLDGFIPLAYLLNDKEKIEVAKKYIDAILERQNEDGWICPCSPEERRTYDVWAVFLITKVLVVYYECSKDDRIEGAVYKTLKNLYYHVEGNTLFNWGLSRWYECLISIFWLYERKKEDWLIELCYKLKFQGLDVKSMFDQWIMEKPVSRWSYLTHVVNFAMSLKAEGLVSRFTDTDGNEWAKKALSLLQRDHGMATGHFTGDECLSGTSPIQGSECCSVVEAMYSYEQLISITGDIFWSDILEKIAFNAFPATTSPDMWTHQYDQQTNQVEASILPREKNIFRTNNTDAHLFGLEPNFGCCTANFNQGWPKFALSTVMKSEEGFAVTAIAPVTVKADYKGVAVEINVSTEYPFKDSYKVTVTTERPLEMTLDLRIPSFVKSAAVNGNKAEHGFYKFTKVWEGSSEVLVSFEYETKFVERPNQMYCIQRGPLLYALTMNERWVKHEYERGGVERKFPYCDYEIFAETPWNYGFAEKDICSAVAEINEKNIGEYPFSQTNPPVEMYVKAAPIDWGFENGLCYAQPMSRKAMGPVEKVKFIPYGCTNLRLTELPVAE